jgi:hypothetical protein
MFPTRPRAIGAIVCLAATLGCSRSEPPLVRITSHDFGYAAPDTIGSGIVHFRLVNLGPDIHEAMLVRFDSTGSARGYIDSVRAHVDFPAFALDIGGTGLASPGDSNDAWLDLAPGHYGLLCWKGDHLSRGMAQDLFVTSSNGPTPGPPPADVTITMTEYGYRITGDLTSGTHVVRVDNHGEQPHEADIVRLAPGKTARDYLDWLEHDEEGLPPSAPVSGAGDFIGGRTVWMRVTLTPGRYLIVCQVPDANGGAPHYKLGMTREFEVT